MVRIARVVASGLPHHITQRGNRWQETLFCNADYRAYIDLMAEWCKRCKVEVWAYCFMPNHVHVIVVPETEDGLRKAIGEAHRRYSRMINFREKWKGHLWQGRFASYPMEENYLLAAARYVELNPVRAELTKEARKYPWSSAAAHISGRDDRLVKVEPLLEIVKDWKLFLLQGIKKSEIEAIRTHERTGRPLGSEVFVNRLEKELERILHKQKPGPEKKGDS